MYQEERNQSCIAYMHMQQQIGFSDCGGSVKVKLQLPHVMGRNWNAYSSIKRRWENTSSNPFTCSCFYLFHQRNLPRESPVASTKKRLHVYCSCRLPDSGHTMIHFSHCNEWYHISFVKVPKQKIKDVHFSCLQYYRLLYCYFFLRSSPTKPHSLCRSRRL